MSLLALVRSRFERQLQTAAIVPEHTQGSTYYERLKTKILLLKQYFH